jgi:hypothetical protein
VVSSLQASQSPHRKYYAKKPIHPEVNAEIEPWNAMAHFPSFVDHNVTICLNLLGCNLQLMSLEDKEDRVDSPELENRQN